MKLGKQWTERECLTFCFCFVSSPLNCRNRLGKEAFTFTIADIQMNLADFDSKELGSHFKNNEKIY